MWENSPKMDDRNKGMPENAYNDEPPTPQDQSRRRMLKGIKLIDCIWSELAALGSAHDFRFWRGKCRTRRNAVSKIDLAASIVALFAISAVAQADSAKISPYLADNPNDLSGMQHTQSHKGYQQFDFDTVDLEALKKEGGRLYSSKEDVMKVLTGGVKNPTGEKEIWKEGLLFEGIEPMPWLESAANWFPKTEKVQPNEMRVTFMGTSPIIRPGQMNTSIYVELGNGDNFIFDLGEGSIANYAAAGLALNELTKVFITHLHFDHYGSLPYLYEFGGWNGRWSEPLTLLFILHCNQYFLLGKLIFLSFFCFSLCRVRAFTVNPV